MLSKNNIFIGILSILFLVVIGVILKSNATANSTKNPSNCIQGSYDNANITNGNFTLCISQVGSTIQATLSWGKMSCNEFNIPNAPSIYLDFRVYDNKRIIYPTDGSLTGGAVKVCDTNTLFVQKTITSVVSGHTYYAEAGPESYTYASRTPSIVAWIPSLKSKIACQCAYGGSPIYPNNHIQCVDPKTQKHYPIRCGAGSTTCLYGPDCLKPYPTPVITSTPSNRGTTHFNFHIF